MQRLIRLLLEHLSTTGLVRRGLRARNADAAGLRDDTHGVLTLLAWDGHDALRFTESRRAKVLAALVCAALSPNIDHGTYATP